MSILWLDYESRSKCDLPKRGVYNYVKHSSTTMLCAAYAFDDEDVQVWMAGEKAPARLAEYFRHGGEIRCHNSSFDRLLTWYVVCCDYHLPEPALDRWYCTAAQARANCLPGSLEDVGRAVSSKMRKDYRGAELIRKLCIPEADGSFNDDPILMAEMIAYCEQDVRTMREISKSLRDLTAEELHDYHTNERINDRGVLVDVPLCRAAQEYASAELSEAQEVFRNITGLESIRSPRMREWVLNHVGPLAKELMVVYKDGEKKYSVDKTVRANLLTFAEERPAEVPPDVVEVLQCADDVWASSVAKFQRLANLADEEDGRVRGAFVFNGGSATGRASSYGAQVHNFTRKCAKEPADVRQAMVRGHEIVPKFGKRTSDVLKGMLRPALIPAKGKVFVVSDWAGIEARMNPWLSNQRDAEQVLDVFRTGKDIYIREAAGIFNCADSDVDSAKRQIGKVAILSCGYAGGVGAFASMGRNYGVLLPESDAKRTVDAWRRANRWAVFYWQDLEEAYTRAMRNKGVEFSAGRTTYLFDGQHLWYMLPSGRVLCYPFAKLDGDGVSYLKAAWKPAADAKEWPRARLWKGLAAENLCQAASNDLLRNTLRQFDTTVLHIHDEAVLEVPEAEAQAAGEALEKVMVAPPAWATGLPLAVEWKIMERYGK